ncbi:MAG: glycosyltransferase family 2 protein [Bacillota bacterium]|nr:glycosyltransferase family 2 protein [Bacillota bacterium]
MTELAVIIPVFNEGKVIRRNLGEILNELAESGIKFNFMIVDDGSSDNTWDELKAAAEGLKNINLLRFSRNFGKEAAILAGIEHITAERYLIMDSDLQHPPRCVRAMLTLMESGHENIIDGIKITRGKESGIHRLYAKTFYRLYKAATGINLDNSSDFKLFDRHVAEALCGMREAYPFFRGLAGWAGFTRAPYYFTVDERLEGGSRFTPIKLMRLAFGALLSFSAKPLYLIFYAGVLMLVLAAALLIGTRGMALEISVLFTDSAILISLGVIGFYLARIYEEVKKRPRYIVSERIEK